MRIPVTPRLSTKDGSSNSNSRLTNMLKEVAKTGEKAVIRPGLVETFDYGGIGNGLIAFDGRLLNIVDDKVYLAEYTWAYLDASDWDSGTTYNYGDFVWYLGGLWGAIDSNTNQVPFLNSTHWKTIIEIYDWVEGDTYAIGDPVVYNGTIYYSLAPSNTGNNPASSAMWSTSAPGTSRYRVNINYIAALNATTPGPECASYEAAAAAWFGTATTFISCATKAGGTNNWVTYVGIQDRGAFGVFVRVNQWIDPSPGDCSGTPLDSGVIDGGKLIQTV